MKLGVITGEASGDLQAAGVVHELRKLIPNLEVFGMGGDHLRAEGVRTTHDIRDMGVVGLFNVLKHLPMFRRVFAELISCIERERPEAVMLVDYPDFNLRLARKIHELGIKVIYYISPQVWAWRTSRVHHIAKYVDQMIVLFPFEEPFYRKHGVPVEYVGHPLVEQLESLRSKKHAPGGERPLKLALLPGSRRGEVASLLEPMLRAVELLRKERSIDSYVVKASTIDASSLQQSVRAISPQTRIVESHGRAAVADADLVFASSGTATLETAVLGVPLVVMYRLSPMTHLVARRLVKLPHFSLVNIVAEREVVPELLQHDVNPEKIAKVAGELLQPERYNQTVAALHDVASRLGEHGASARAASVVARVMGAAR